MHIHEARSRRRPIPFIFTDPSSFDGKIDHPCASIISRLICLRINYMWFDDWMSVYAYMRSDAVSRHSFITHWCRGREGILLQSWLVKKDAHSAAGSWSWSLEGLYKCYHSNPLCSGERGVAGGGGEPLPAPQNSLLERPEGSWRLSTPQTSSVTPILEQMCSSTSIFVCFCSYSAQHTSLFSFSNSVGQNVS